MTTAFPNGIDTFVNPAATDALNSATVPHVNQHDNLNDAVLAIQNSLGANLGKLAPQLPQRLLPKIAAYPQLMVSPPICGAAIAGSPASSITSAVAITALVTPGVATTISTNFTYMGADMIINAGNYFVTPSVRTGIASNYAIEGDFFGLAFEFGYKGQGTLSSRVWVDGQPAEAAYIDPGAQDAAIHLRKVTFSAAAWHHIRIEFAANFWGLNIGPTDTWIPAPLATRRLLVIGDSYGNGTGSTAGFNCYAQTLGILLDFPSVYSESLGGTGLLAAGSFVTYRGRAGDWSARNCTAAVIQMSINDDGSTPSAIAAELALLVPLVQALPTVKNVWIMGTSARGGADVAGKQTREVTLAAAAAALGVPYINLVSPRPLWTGTGRVGATTGSGNSDIVMSSDNAHPSQVGHDMIARGVAAGIINSRPTG